MHVDVGKTTRDMRGGIRTGSEDNVLKQAALRERPVEVSCDDSRASGGKDPLKA